MVPQFSYWSLHPRVILYLARKANKLYDAGMLRLNARRPGGRTVVAVSKAGGSTQVVGVAVYRKKSQTLELYGCLSDNSMVYSQLMSAIADKAHVKHRTFVENTCEVTNSHSRGR